MEARTDIRRSDMAKDIRRTADLRTENVRNPPNESNNQPFRKGWDTRPVLFLWQIRMSIYFSEKIWYNAHNT